LSQFIEYQYLSLIRNIEFKRLFTNFEKEFFNKTTSKQFPFKSLTEKN